MASLMDRINQDLVTAQKARDEVTVSTLRLLLADVKNAQIAKGEELDDQGVVSQIQKGAKKRKESIEAYGKADRGDLVDKEKAELEVLQKYLPEQLLEQDVAKIVDEVISQTGAVSAADMGKVMQQVMGMVSGKADGGLVLRIVKEKLAH